MFKNGSMRQPTIEFVLGLSIGFIYAYISAYAKAGKTGTASRASSSITCKCPRTFNTSLGGVSDHSSNHGNSNQENDMEFRSEQPLPHAVHPDDTVNSTALKNSARLLCWIMTSPQNLQKRAKYVKMTWVQRCDKYVFISTKSNYEFPTVGVPTFEGRKYLTEKTMLGFEYIYNKHFNDADWFLKIDDDAYVIVENLRYFLSTQNSEEPIYFGHHFKVMVKQGYFSGGSGFVLSKEALRRFGQHGNESNRCRNQHGVGGDVKFGVCMQNLGVRTGNSLDKYGRNRFHCFNPETHLKGDYPSWYYKYDANGAKAGPNSMSSYPISFHYMDNLMLTVHQLLYNIRPYGIKMDETEDVNQKQTNQNGLYRIEANE